MKHAEANLFEEEEIENALERKDLSKGGRSPYEEHSAIQNTGFATVLQSL